LILTLLLIRWCVFFFLVANLLTNGLITLGCQVGRTNPLSVKALQTVVVCRMSLLSQVRFVSWV
ncbi:hypothetical protein, partial [Vibrio cyclitrophicus]|uniref:hypothetical protein n=1 Tax=Vibrio cyclitrophicus TaxID=47951 RepID=UPI001C9778F1